MDSDGLAARIGQELGAKSPDVSNPNRASAPPLVLDHELIGRIGGGSYGEVWLAKSVTGQMRAIKIVWRRNFSCDRPYEREFRGIVQFEPISRLHPGVIQILHVGRDESAGCFYYVMELADPTGTLRGAIQTRSAEETLAASEPCPPEMYSPRTLAADLKALNRLPVTEVLTLGIQLADALGHLHRNHLVHRDVKPSNVIFLRSQAKLADIGLVTGTDEARSFVGTEGFIPPEGPGTAQADLFGLGRLLYEAATGKDRCEFPALPEDLDQWPDRVVMLEINEVLSRACASEPRHRHANAAELAGDLNLILAGRSVRRAYGVERRLRRATWTTVLALLVVFVAIFSNWVQRRQKELADARAKQESALRERAEAAELKERQQLYTALLEQARATVLSGELGHRFRALDAIRRAAAISNTAELRREAVAALGLPDLRFDRELPRGQGITLVQIDPAFERIALCRGNGPVEIRSAAGQRLLATLPARTNLPSYGALWSRDGRFLAVKRDHDPGGERAEVEVWEVGNARRPLLLQDVPWGAMSFHPSLHRIMAGRKGGAVTVWDLENGEEVIRFQLAAQPVRLGFAPGGERFAWVQSVGTGGMLSVNSTTNGALQVSHLFADDLGSIRWHPSGRWISAPDDGGGVHLIDSQTGEARTLGRHKAEAVVAEFSPDGGYLVSGGWDRELICWDLRSVQRAFTMGLKSFTPQFRADGQELAVVTDEAVQIHAFELPSGHREFAEDLGARLRHATFSPDGRWLAASGDGRLGVWDLRGQGPGALASEGAGTRIFFAANGEMLASRDRDCSRWRVMPGRNDTAPPELQRLGLRKPEGYTSLCVASNVVALTGSKGSQVVTLDNIAADESHWARTSYGVNGASPDARWLAIYPPYTPFLYVYGLPGLEPVAKLTNRASIAHFTFSPLADELAVGSRDRVEFWSTKTWRRTREFTNCVDIVFTPDGRSWWLTQDLRTAALCDARTLEPLLPLPTGTLPLALSPDGRHLAVSVDARRLQLWDLAEVRERIHELGVDWTNDR